MTEFYREATVCKVSEELGLIFGFAIVCKQDGEPYFDLQDDHIPEQSMLKAATDFMLGARLAKEMHQTDDGTVVFAFPLTEEIAKALDIQTRQTGLLVALRPDSAETLEKAKNGEFRGFSIGGSRIQDEEINDG